MIRFSSNENYSQKLAVLLNRHDDVLAML